MANEFFKPPASPIDAAQIGNLLNNALEGMEPKTAKDSKSKAAWRLQIIKSAKGEAIAKTLSTRLQQNVSFMTAQNDSKNKELEAVIKTFSSKAAADLKKQYDGLMQKSLDDAVAAMKNLAKSA